MSLVDGKLYVAPNGKNIVKIYPHGFVEPWSDIDQRTGEIIQEMSQLSASKLPKDATPFEVFEFMGWKEFTPPALKQKPAEEGEEKK